MTTHKEIRGGWELHGDKPVDDFGLFRTRKSLRRNVKNGAEIEFFLIDGHNWANVITTTPDDKFLLVRQYRHGSEEYSLEVPGGCIEPGEDPGEGIIRELREETGYEASHFELIGTMRPNPAMLSNHVFIYVARNAELKAGTSFDPGEDIETVLVPRSEMKDLILSGKFTHAINVAAFGLYFLREERK